MERKQGGKGVGGGRKERATGEGNVEVRRGRMWIKGPCRCKGLRNWALKMLQSRCFILEVVVFHPSSHISIGYWTIYPIVDLTFLNIRITSI